MKTSRIQNVVRTACGLWVVTAVSAFAAQTTILRVPTLGGSDVDVRALNNVGGVAGFSRTAANEQHAFRYQSGVMLDLGTLGGNVSLATALSETNKMVGD